MTVNVDTTNHGYEIPIDFSGLSFERGTENAGNAGVPGYLFALSNTQLITLFQNIGIKSLRVGAGSVDTEIPVGTGSDGFTAIDNLFQFAQAAGVKVLYSVRLLNPSTKPIPNLKSDDTASAQYIWQNYRSYLSAFSIGNEPDFHSYHTATNHPVDPLIFETLSGVPGSAYPSYFADWSSFADAILGVAPGAQFAGPDTGSYSNTPNTYTPNPATGVSWTQQFADDEKNSVIIADVTQHYYVGGGPGSTTAQQAIDNMLSPEWVNNNAIGTQPAGTTDTTTYSPYPWLYANNLAPVLATGLPYRLTESNDYLTGVPGASNGYASALWALDYMHWWAEHGAAGVNFHNKQWIYTDTIAPSPNPCSGPCGNYQAAPKGYGMKAFDLSGHGYVEPVTISNPSGANVTAYAVGQAQDLYVTIINKAHGTGAPDANVTIQPQGMRSASVQAMMLTSGVPGDATPMTATLGGASIANNARWSGKWTAIAPDTGGRIALTVQAATAAVIRIHAASAYAGPVQINQNGTLELFGVAQDGSIWKNMQSPAGSTASGPDNWTGWAGIQGSALSRGGVAVVKNLNNTLEIFVPSTTGTVYHRWQVAPDGDWSDWADLGGDGIASLVASTNADGSVSLFGIGTNGDIWYNSQNAPGVGWSGWSDLTGTAIQPGYVVGQNLDGHLELVGADAGGTVWSNVQTDGGGWSGWSTIAGQILDPHFAVARNLDGRLEVFGLAANGDIWHNSQKVAGGAWSDWGSLDAKVAGVPPGHEKLTPGFMVGQNNDGSLVVFGVGRGTRDVWMASEQGPGGDWSGWADLGGKNMDPRLVVSSTADGRIQLFGIGSNGDVWSDWQQSTGGSWAGWTDFGGNGLTFYAGPGYAARIHTLPNQRAVAATMTFMQ